MSSLPSWLPNPLTPEQEQALRMIGLPHPDDDLEAGIAWYGRLVAAYSDMVRNQSELLGELFRVVFEIPEAEQRYRQILRERRSLEENKETIRQHAARKDAVMRFLRENGLEP